MVANIYHGKKKRTAYRVWLSEVMLQQTQVQTVIPYYLRFLTKFPNVTALANASLDDVLHAWAGLGYYSRARNLHKTAILIRDKFHGKFPTSLESMIALPGIGRSTASAILAFCDQQTLPILDGNVKRVLSRLHAISTVPQKNEKELWLLAQHYTPEKTDIIDYTQAIMDLGAMICTRHSPKCTECPVAQECLAYTRNETALYPVKAVKKSLPIKKIFLMVLINKKMKFS
ncbi:MAG: A/G-specific adenine glycosylase [Gammaproteobacteria bacterium]|nr:A/G-specific adenine glycosylase [Gammaproteobacteria bacterium]